MNYEYKGMLPLEEQRKAITKLIEELAAQIGSSVERLELIETDDYVVIGTDDLQMIEILYKFVLL